VSAGRVNGLAVPQELLCEFGQGHHGALCGVPGGLSQLPRIVCNEALGVQVKRCVGSEVRPVDFLGSVEADLARTRSAP
jgi:hypothetical protein